MHVTISGSKDVCLSYRQLRTGGYPAVVSVMMNCKQILDPDLASSCVVNLSTKRQLQQFTKLTHALQTIQRKDANHAKYIKRKQRIQKMKQDNLEMQNQLYLLQTRVVDLQNRVADLESVRAENTNLGNVVTQLYDLVSPEDAFLMRLNTTTQKKWEIIHVNPDGNCFYRAVAVATNKLDREVAMQDRKAIDGVLNHLRKQCFKYCVEHNELFAGLYRLESFESKSWEIYRNLIKKDGFWSGDIEMFAMRMILQREIYYYNQSDVINLTLRSPFCNDEETCKKLQKDYPLPIDSQPPIILLYTGNHYELLQEKLVEDNGKKRRRKGFEE